MKIYQIAKCECLGEFAEHIRELADEVEAGRIACVGFVVCDENGDGGPACFVSSAVSGEGRELINEMTDALKERLLETYKAGHPTEIH